MDFKLINDDCLLALKTIPDNSVDLVVTDPPYLFESDGGGGKFGSKHRTYHNELKTAQITKGFNKEILDELVRIMKAVNIYIFCNKNQLLDYMLYFKDYNMDLLTWHKTNPTPTCNNKYLSDTEYILFFRENKVRVYGNYHTKQKYFITEINKRDKDLYHHPTIKPLSIIETLINNSSIEGETILDCFMGSGTTGVACKNLDRNFIGMEIDRDYFETAKKRIANVDLQPKLF